MANSGTTRKENYQTHALVTPSIAKETMMATLIISNLTKRKRAIKRRTRMIMIASQTTVTIISLQTKTGNTIINQMSLKMRTPAAIKMSKMKKLKGAL